MAEPSNGNHTVVSVTGGDATDIPPPPAEPSNGNHTVVSVRGEDLINRSCPGGFIVFLSGGENNPLDLPFGFIMAEPSNGNHTVVSVRGEDPINRSCPGGFIVFLSGGENNPLDLPVGFIMAEPSNGNHTVVSVRGEDPINRSCPGGFILFLSGGENNPLDLPVGFIMAEPSNGNYTVVSVRGGDATNYPPLPAASLFKDFDVGCSVPFKQKLMVEVLGTFFLMFIRCASVVVNSNEDKAVTLPGIAIVWGLAVTTLIYSLGHVSGAHFNPAVTIALASCKRFPFKQLPAYMAAQLLGSTLAAATLRLLFIGKNDVFFGTSPQGSDLQGFVMEFIITFYLMFVVSGVATDNRAVGKLAGLAVGSTVLITVLFAGPITGASMNPARTLGPAIVSNQWKGIWIYLTSPILGAVSAAWVYNMLRTQASHFCVITKAASFLKSASSG